MKLMPMKNKEKLWNGIFVYCILLWPIIHFCIFTIGMNISMVVQSFQDYPTTDFYFFENYKDVFLTFFGKNPQSELINTKAIWNSLSILPLTLFINMPISLIFAFAIYKKYFGHQVFRVVLFIPTVISAVVLCLVFNMAVSRDVGFIPKLLEGIGLEKVIPDNGFMGDEKSAWGMILIFSVWTGISTNLIYFCSAMGRLPAEVFESAQLDGASDFKQFYAIAVPLVWSTVTTISITGISTIFSWYLPSLLLTNGTNGTSTLGLMVVVSAQSRTNLGFISALGVIIAIIGTCVTLLGKKLLGSIYSEVEY
jgi:ABC-type sugar transport system permease subunit